MSLRSRRMQRSLHCKRAKLIAPAPLALFGEAMNVQCVGSVQMICLGFSIYSARCLADLVNAKGYLVLETPHAMQMKPPFFSKHAIPLIVPQFMRPWFVMIPSNASIQLSCMFLQIIVDSFPKQRSSVPITSSNSSLLVTLDTSPVIS